MVNAAFILLGVLAILAGGLISAFTASNPSRTSVWLSAYLVLVVGIIQLGLIDAWYRLGRPQVVVTLLAFILYNLGNASVISGTILKTKVKYSSLLVKFGGVLIGLAMAFLLYSIKHAHISWALVEFITLTLTILISMPIGLTLSSKRHKELKNGINS